MINRGQAGSDPRARGPGTYFGEGPFRDARRRPQVREAHKLQWRTKKLFNLCNFTLGHVLTRKFVRLKSGRYHLKEPDLLYKMTLKSRLYE
jgi:hypothetical protein